MAKNIYYHYTAKQFIYGIKKNGLMNGRTPIENNDGSFSFIKNHQWLTTDKNYDNQVWAIPQKISYSRREIRLKINIPKPFMKNIMGMIYFCEEWKDFLPVGFNDFPELTKDWCVYIGRIDPRWIEEYRVFGEY